MQILSQIELAISLGADTFISGMARGVDIWACEIIMMLKRSLALKLVCIIPFKGQDEKWDENWKRRYHEILSTADETIVLNEVYHPGCFAQRNKKMVDMSDLIIAVYKPESAGGTAQTIAYATKKNKAVKIIPVKKAF